MKNEKENEAIVRKKWEMKSETRIDVKYKIMGTSEIFSVKI